MGRAVRDWKPIRADQTIVAPHRYLWSGTIDADGKPVGDIEDAPDHKAARACIPYKEGEVIYVERYTTLGAGFARALVYRVVISRDRWGDRRELYYCQVETQTGTFSKLWEKFHPGFVQRGYKNAGLAPDVK